MYDADKFYVDVGMIYGSNNISIYVDICYSA